ncbi:MAG: ABC transporter substrate-binding protein [Candidatus Edwardsbacteria bacterium]|jgi:peptide/nickel transport system substrate-binding protein|nr:ABC transporter substrate-binding protein [Candidatus Edwardsbacteria bacterium]
MRRITCGLLAAALLAATTGMGGRPRAVFTMAMEERLLSLDPHAKDEGVTHSVLSNVYDALVAFDAQMRIVPALALSWENPDELTWRFRLRPGVTFHDGRRLSAADVRHSLERAGGRPVGYYLASVAAVRVVDDLTVELVTARPSPVLLNKLTFVRIVPVGSPDTISTPIGTGAYRVVSYAPGDSLVLAANPGHWGGRPAIGNAVIRFIQDSKQRLQALLDGRVHLIRDVTALDLEAAGDISGITVAKSAGLMVGLLGINVRMKGPLAKTKVREAIYWALDPAELIAATKIDAAPIDQLVSPYIVGYLPDLVRNRPDREKARRLLREAGYPKGFAVGLEVTRGALTKSGPVLVRQLAAVGIRVTLKPYEWSDLSDRLGRWQSPFYMVGWSCSSGDASDLFDACLHTADRRNGSYGNANWGGYSNRRLDELIERSGQTLDSRARIEMLQQAMRLAMRDLPLVPLYVKSRLYAHHPQVLFTPRQDGYVRLNEIGFRR